MIAIVLAAGVSSRLRPLTNNTPKCLLPVGGTPLLARTLSALQQSGIERCILVTGYHAAMVEKFVLDLALPLAVDFVFNAEYGQTNNNYSLWLASTQATGKDILLLDADILFAPELLIRLIDDPHPNALLLRPGDHLGDEEIKVQLDQNGRVVKIGKNVLPLDAVGESIGIEKFSAATAARLFNILAERKDRYEFYEASFQQLIDEGATLFTVDAGNFPCIEIDTPDDLAAAERLARPLKT